MAEKKKKEHTVKMIRAGAYTKKLRKIDQQGLSFQSKEVEDNFANITGIDDALPPPFNPKWLRLLTTHNNTLNQAISAMEINIDGSGHVIEAKDDDSEVSEEDIKQVEDFFDEVAPCVSFLTLRRQLRRDLESVGYGFIELIRNMEQKVVAMKRVDPTTMRLLKLRDSVLVDKTLMRGGTELIIQMHVRERKFVQVVGHQKTFFAEWQASRKLNKITGLWVKEGEKIEMKDQATELMYFTVEEEANGPYGVPRWINNLPSVLGSRQAEEENLNFFDNGAVPPVIITVMGGKMAGDVKKQLQNFLSSKNANTRVVVLEAQADDGAIESTTSKLKIDVQRFGSERIQDSMFENYDEKSSERVRSSFRLAPLFIGKVRDFNLATAMTSYMVTESQVFQPERMEFDSIITKFIGLELEKPDIQIRSLPIVLTDAKVQLDALKYAFDKGTIDSEQLISSLNSITALGLTFDETLEVEPEEEEEEVIAPEDQDEDQDEDEDQDDDSQKRDHLPGQMKPKPKGKEKKYTIHKDAKDITFLIDMANDIVKLVGAKGDEENAEDKQILEKYNKMKIENQVFVRDLISMKVLDNTDIDREGANELLEGCLHTLDESEEEHGKS